MQTIALFANGIYSILTSYPPCMIRSMQIHLLTKVDMSAVSLVVDMNVHSAGSEILGDHGSRRDDTMALWALREVLLAEVLRVVRWGVNDLLADELVFPLLLNVLRRWVHGRSVVRSRSVISIRLKAIGIIYEMDVPLEDWNFVRGVSILIFIESGAMTYEHDKELAGRISQNWTGSARGLVFAEAPG